MAESLYIHIPFCKHICAYCDFNRVGYHRRLAENYLISLQKNLEESCSGSFFKTIYLGGGTPSALDLDLFEKCLQMISEYSTSCVEYTMEANPESLSLDKISLLRKYGITRVSLGVQSTDDNLLQLMNRHHTNEMVLNCIQLLHDYGIEHISIDLIYSLPTQTMETWKNTLKTVVRWPIDHISLYSLTIEENSQFRRLGYDHLDEDTEADMYEYACSYLKKYGFEHYEVSNFAKKNGKSQHNLAYWHYDDFVGVGLGASGKENHMRYEIVSNYKQYNEYQILKDVTALTREDEMFEEIMMGLRIFEGVNKSRFKARYQVSVNDVYKNSIDKNVSRGWLCDTDEALFVTQKGMACLNELLIDFMD